MLYGVALSRPTFSGSKQKVILGKVASAETATFGEGRFFVVFLLAKCWKGKHELRDEVSKLLYSMAPPEDSWDEDEEAFWQKFREVIVQGKGDPKKLRDRLEEDIPEVFQMGIGEEMSRQMQLLILDKSGFKQFTWKIVGDLKMEGFSKGLHALMANFGEKLETPDLPPALRNAFLQFFKGYFDNAALVLKMRMSAAYLASPPKTDLNTQMTMVLQESGPLCQKWLQSAGDKVADEHLRELLGAFKNSITPMARSELEKQLETAGILEGSDPEVFHLRLQGKAYSIPADPSSAASIGQGHLATAKEGGGHVFVKVKRRFLREKLNAEIQMLDRCSAGSPATEKLLDVIVKKGIEMELDLQQEVRFMEMGYERYQNEDTGVTSVKVLGSYPEGDPAVIAMDFIANADTLADWISKGSDDPREVCEAVRVHGAALRQWAEEALINSGFFHGDPHAGNLMIRFDDGAGQIIFIDYGNSHIDPNLLAPFSKFVLGVLLERDSLIFEVFRPVNDAAKEKVRKDFKEKKVFSSKVGKAKKCMIGAARCSWQAMNDLWNGKSFGDMKSDFESWAGSAIREKLKTAFNDVVFRNLGDLEVQEGVFHFYRALGLFEDGFAQMEKKHAATIESHCPSDFQPPLIHVCKMVLQNALDSKDAYVTKVQMSVMAFILEKLLEIQIP